MSPLVQAALIAAIPTTLAVFGAMGRYIVTTILDAYKAQASSTVAAKDAEIHMLERMLTEERAEVARLHTVTSDLHLILKALGE